ncbi:hypothetical protein Lal_00033053 [Lupinus albus]|nr:hypothetical protein Lal_00033053 [Lupinus albus]
MAKMRDVDFFDEIQVYTWWDVIPKFIFEEFNKNRLVSLPKCSLGEMLFRDSFLKMLTRID